LPPPEPRLASRRWSPGALPDKRVSCRWYAIDRVRTQVRVPYAAQTGQHYVQIGCVLMTSSSGFVYRLMNVLRGSEEWFGGLPCTQYLAEAPMRSQYREITLPATSPMLRVGGLHTYWWNKIASPAFPSMLTPSSILQICGSRPKWDEVLTWSMKPFRWLPGKTVSGPCTKTTPPGHRA
jgi:hypothetical protein